MSIFTPRLWPRSVGGVSALPVILGLLLIGACSKPPAEVPDILLGTWVTDAPSHAGRHFIVRPDALLFGTGAFSGNNVYAIESVEPLAPRADWTPFRISIREVDGQISNVELAHRAGSTAELSFVNRPEIWRRKATIPNPANAAPPQKNDQNDARMSRERGNG